MNKLLLFVFILVSACTVREQQKPFPASAISNDVDWSTYEGKWLTKDGVIRFELSLKSGAFGYDSYYKLNESFETNSLASGAASQGFYSSYDGLQNNEFRLCLHDVNAYDKGGYLRFKKLDNIAGKDEMFFMTRGNDELLPCDNNFKPLTLDRRYTLHRRSKLFTVEGYFTMEQDSVQFFERNTGEYWKVTDLGEFNELIVAYNRLAKEKSEGIYLKALAYSVRDTISTTGKDVLVIKRIKSLGNDPD